MARKYGTNEEVVNAYVRGEEYPCINSNNSISHVDGILKSYMEPICVRRNNGKFIVNGDKFTVTTSHHQSLLQNRLMGHSYFTTSFSALEDFVGGVSTISLMRSRRGLFAERLRNEVEIVDNTKDLQASYDPNNDVFRDAGDVYTWEQLPQGAEIRYQSEYSKEGTFLGHQIHSAHMAASAVFKYGEHYALASMDEQQFFVSILPRPVDSVSDAFCSLKPEEVEEAESKGMEIYRQGEWFFIPHLTGKEAREQYNRMESEFKLVGRNGGNPHVATRGEWLREGVAEVSGRIRHDEHRTLQLSWSNDPVIFIAMENTALISHSAAGKVD